VNKIFFIIKEKSERIKNKNFQKISGIPLYKISLYKFKKFKVFVDTDSEKIISECKKDKNLKHVYCYKRDEKFINMEKSLTQSPTPLMIKNFLENFVKNDKEQIITSHVTSPFLRIKTLNDALNKMSNYDSVCSCEKIQNFSYLENSRFKPINFNPRLIQKTQSLKKIIVLNGAFFIIKKNIFLNNGLRRISDKHFFYELTIPESLDIDYREHLFLARKLSKLNL
jgi:CMP-N-acetylneuraminic acid synthetase